MSPPSLTGERALFDELLRAPSKEEEVDDLDAGEEPGSEATLASPGPNAGDEELPCSTLEAPSVVAAVATAGAIAAHMAHGNIHAMTTWKKCMVIRSTGVCLRALVHVVRPCIYIHVAIAIAFASDSGGGCRGARRRLRARDFRNLRCHSEIAEILWLIYGILRWFLPYTEGVLITARFNYSIANLSDELVMRTDR